MCVSVCENENVCVCTQVNKLEYLKYLSAGIEQWFTIDEIENANLNRNGKFTKVEVRFIESIGQFVLSGVTQRSTQL